VLRHRVSSSSSLAFHIGRTNPETDDGAIKNKMPKPAIARTTISPMLEATQ